MTLYHQAHYPRKKSGEIHKYFNFGFWHLFQLVAGLIENYVTDCKLSFLLYKHS